MLKKVLKEIKDAPGNPHYWVCTKCNWPFMSLQEANRHSQDCRVNDDVVEYKNEVGPE